MLWWMFTDPAARTVLVDWEAEAAALLARYRAAVGRHPDDPAFEEHRPAACRQLRSPSLVATPRHRTPELRHQTAAPP